VVWKQSDRSLITRFQAPIQRRGRLSAPSNPPDDLVRRRETSWLLQLYPRTPLMVFRRHCHNVVSNPDRFRSGDLQFTMSFRKRITSRAAIPRQVCPESNDHSLAACWGLRHHIPPAHGVSLMDAGKSVPPREYARFGGLFSRTLGRIQFTGKNYLSCFGIAGSTDTLLPQINITRPAKPQRERWLRNNDAKNNCNDTVIEARTRTWTWNTCSSLRPSKCFRYRTDIFILSMKGLAGNSSLPPIHETRLPIQLL